MGRMLGSALDRARSAEQAWLMHRHEFLELLAGCIAIGACGAPVTMAAAPAQRSPAGSRPKIRAICFDLFTLFDPRSVVTVARELVGEPATALCETWRSRQFEYGFLRAAAGQYQDFRAVTSQALDYAARAQKVSLSSEQRESLVEAYSQLEPWPDTRERLLDFKKAGLHLAPLANYSPRMLSSLLAHARLEPLFDAQISTDAARSFKPDPRAYALGPSTLKLQREEIAFAAFGGWDAAGARWFGYPTFWVNRLAVTPEALAPGPDATGPTLAELAQFVAEW
jgi:2-haloacid dehalogenase